MEDDIMESNGDNTLNGQAENINSYENSIIPLSEQKVRILITDADINGREIAKMSDFMETYAKQQVSYLNQNAIERVVKDIPISDIGIISDVIQQTIVTAKGNISLIPDFDHLPLDIREKLKKGIYSIGESKQVDGNLRAVIVNEDGVRVKDITLKKIFTNPGTLETTRSISNQLQLKQISDKLTAIQEIQDYQLDKDRDHAIFTPFLRARDNIHHAQDAEISEKRNEYLEKAADLLIESKNAVYTEMRTAVKHLARCSKWPIFHKQSTVNTLIRHISEDLQLSTKVCGILVQVYEYLGQPKNAISEMKQYKDVMADFLINKIGDTGYTAIELMHDNFKYDKSNLDCWYNLSIELKPQFSDIDKLTDTESYIVTLEDTKDE